MTKIIFVLFSAAAFVSSAFSQETSRETKPQSTDQKIRRVYVPEGDLQKVIRGRYLPIEIAKLNELLDRVNLVENSGSIQSMHLQLDWNPEKGMTGTCSFSLGDELQGNLVSFVSSFHHSNLRCLDSKFAFSNMGRTLDGDYSVSSISGTEFQCDLVLPGSYSMEGRRLLLPQADLRSVSIRIPTGYQLLSTGITTPISRVVPSDQSQVFFLDVNGSQLDLSIAAHSGNPSLVVSENEVDWLENRVTWTSKMEIPLDAFFENQFTVLVDGQFECQSVSLNGRTVNFLAKGITKELTAIVLENPGVSKSVLNYEFAFEKRIDALSSFNFRPLKIEQNVTMRCGLRIKSSAIWKVDEIDPIGFSVTGVGASAGTQLIQTNSNGNVEIRFSRRVPELATDNVELDFQSDEVRVRQLIRNLEDRAVLEIGNEWQVQSVIDVQQDDLPVSFLLRPSTAGANPRNE